jgi:hypothetical protein
MSMPFVSTGPIRERRSLRLAAASAITSHRTTEPPASTPARHISDRILTESPGSVTASDSEAHSPGNSHSLALTNFVVVVKRSDLQSQVKFGSIQKCIFHIADGQILLYQKIANGSNDDDVCSESDNDQIEAADDDIELKSEVGSLSEVETDSDDEESDHSVELTKITREDRRILDGYVFGLDEFRLLEEQLPARGDFLVKLELDNGHLLVRTVPGLLHEITARYFNDELTNWSMIPGRQRNEKYSLTSVGSAGMLPLILVSPR